MDSWLALPHILRNAKTPQSPQPHLNGLRPDQRNGRSFVGPVRKGEFDRFQPQAMFGFGVTGEEVGDGFPGAYKVRG